MKRFFLLVAFSLSFTSCEKPQWLDHIPQNYLGRWVETSDQIVSQQTEPQYFTVSADRIIHSVFIDGEGYRAHVYSFVMAERQGDKILVFCGKPDDRYIAEKRFFLRIESDPKFMRIAELAATGHDDEDTFIDVGRFVQKR